VKYWISCNRFTIQVETDAREVIVWAAPIAHKFRGQPLLNLLNWARKFGGLYFEKL
jgi:hypothetical protein